MVNKQTPAEKLIDFVKAHPQKGLTIPHTQVESIIGIPYRKTCNCINGKYTYWVSKANNVLTGLSLRLESINGFGYRIIEDNGYASNAVHWYNIGVSYIQKAKTVIDATKTSGLNTQEALEFQKAWDKISKASSYVTSMKNTKNKQVSKKNKP